MHVRSSKSIAVLLAAAFLLAPVIAQPWAEAGTNPFVGEIQTFGFNFAPRGWAHCNGQILPIARNSALFSLLGTTFGGDGRTTFGLPDLRGRVAKHPGTGPGLSAVKWGQKSGREKVTLAPVNLPPHTHRANAYAPVAPGNEKLSAGLVLVNKPGQVTYAAKAPAVMMKPAAISLSIANTGGGRAIDIRDPSLGIYHCIALVGTFPSRN